MILESVLLGEKKSSILESEVSKIACAHNRPLNFIVIYISTRKTDNYLIFLMQRFIETQLLCIYIDVTHGSPQLHTIQI